MGTIDEDRNRTALRLFGMTPLEAWGKRICIQCKEPADAKCHTPAGRREYTVSALCEDCFNTSFPPETPQRKLADTLLEAIDEFIANQQHSPDKSDA